MGKLKQSIIDTPLEDQSDPRDPGTYGEPENDEQELLVGHTMFGLDGDITRVEKNTNAFSGEADKLRAFADRLNDAAAKVDVPF